MSEITWTCPEFSGQYGNPNLDKLLTDIESNFDFADRDWPLERRNGDDSVSEDKENFTVALEVLTVVEQEEAQDVLQVINNEVMGRRRRRLKGIHFRPDTNRTGAEGLSFYYPRLLHCPDQMLAVMSFSQH